LHGAIVLPWALVLQIVQNQYGFSGVSDGR